jgi:hypothetical protein
VVSNPEYQRNHLMIMAMRLNLILRTDMLTLPCRFLAIEPMLPLYPEPGLAFGFVFPGWINRSALLRDWADHFEGKEHIFSHHGRFQKWSDAWHISVM